jgi:hypothetical protein
MTPSAIGSPLVEPDVQISRIRLSQYLSPQTVAGSCAAITYKYVSPSRWRCA